MMPTKFVSQFCQLYTVVVIWYTIPHPTLRPHNQQLQPMRLQPLQHRQEGYKPHLVESLTLTTLAMDTIGKQDNRNFQIFPSTCCSMFTNKACTLKGSSPPPVTPDLAKDAHVWTKCD